MSQLILSYSRMLFIDCELKPKFENIVDVLYRILTGTFWTTSPGQESLEQRTHCVTRTNVLSYITYFHSYTYHRFCSSLDVVTPPQRSSRIRTVISCVVHGTVTCSFIRANSTLLSLRLRFRAGDWPIVNLTTVDTCRYDVLHGASCRAENFAPFIKSHFDAKRRKHCKHHSALRHFSLERKIMSSTVLHVHNENKSSSFNKIFSPILSNKFFYSRIKGVLCFKSPINESAQFIRLWEDNNIHINNINS